MKRLFYLACILSSLCLTPASAQEEVDPLDAIQSEKATTEQWALAIAKLADAEKRASVQEAINQIKPYPKAQLVALLTHPKLSARLGAIELLEDASGGDNGYNAWLKPSGETNVTALKLWREWASSKQSIAEKKSNKLSPDKIEKYIQQLLSNDRSRIARATRMLEGDNFNAVASIQQFIVDHPTLPSVKIAQLKQAQYELILIKANRTSASQLSRDLVKGNRDQKLTALASLKKLGLITIPIIRDFIDHPDSLLRETAIDAILTVGGAQTLPFLTKILKEEKDINVLHVAIRNLKDIGGKQTKNLIKGFLTHKDEDLVIASISALTKLMSSGNSLYSFSDSSSKAKKSTPESLKIAKLLKDNRWRVRVAALEHVSKLKVAEAAPDILYLLKNDQDEFVRHHCIKAAVALDIKEAKADLSKLYLNHDNMIASLTNAIVKMNDVLPDKLLKHLKTREPDIIIASLKAFDNSKSQSLKVLSEFAQDKHQDLACAALRILSNDSKKTKVDSVANILTDALKSNNKEKILAVLNSLELPSSDSMDPSLRYLQLNTKVTKRAKNPKLDPLYNAFLLPGGKMLVPDAIHTSNTKTAATGGLATLLASLENLAKKHPSSEQSFQIALLLAKAGDKRGIALIKGKVSEMPVSKRASLARAMYNPRLKENVAIILTLLQDPSKDIRKAAISAAFSNEENKVLIHSALKSIVAEGTKITGADAYTYRTESAANDRNTRSIFYHWCIEQLNKETLEDRTHILSLILIRKIATDTDSDLIAKFTRSKSPWIRRAAWHTLGIINSSWYHDNLETLLADTHPNVRAAISDSHSRADSRWYHIFSDTEAIEEHSYYSNKSRRTLSTKIEKALRKMARTDTSESNRFEAMFTLLSHSRTIDLNEFISLIPKQDKTAKVVSRLSSYVQSDFNRMGKGMRPLLAYVDFKQISRTYHERIIKHFDAGSKTNESAGFTTFDGLAKTSDASKEPQHISTPEEEAKIANKREKMVIIFFEKAGCKKCELVETYLKDMKQDFPLLEIKHELLDNNSAILLNTHLSNKLQVPSNQIRKAPAIYTSHGYLVGSRINPQDLAKLLSNTMTAPEQKEWFLFQNKEEVKVAQEKVNKTFNDLTLPIVIAGGLLDGINPCAFATIIFFLSYLTIAKRSPKEIFFVGFSFILAVFLAYLSFGLIFSKALEYLTANSSYQWIRSALNYVFAGFAILVAALSLRDWWRARQGRLEDMTLQLPSFLKKKIRSVIRENSKSSLYVLAAFGSGIMISVLELACTGQVYAPIIYKINEGSQDAVTMLVIYNLAFVLPLIVIFALAMGGMKSNTLINFQKNHTAKIKLLTAILFFTLAAVLLFSTQISAWAQSFYPNI